MVVWKVLGILFILLSIFDLWISRGISEVGGVPIDFDEDERIDPI